jgi:Protein of unknown function (DUF1579)
MKTSSILIAVCFLTVIVAVSNLSGQDQATPASSPPVATSPVAAPAGSPGEADMMKEMMELSKLNENHKMLGSLSGTWNYTVKFWMNGDPNSKPQESKGTAVRKPLWNGRYYMLDVSGKMQIPGPDGKMKPFNFKGMGLEGYDNAKKKFVSTWMDNLSTGIMMAEGTYDPDTKSITYTGEYEPMPGMKQQVREVVKIEDKNHHTLEWYENRNGQELKTMEIDYTRAGAK